MPTVKDEERTDALLPLSYASPTRDRRTPWEPFWTPMGWGTALTAVAAMLSLFWANRLPMVHVGYGLLGVVLFAVVLLAWLTRFVVQVAVAFRSEEGYVRKRWVGWVVTPAVLLITYGAVRLDVPFNAALAVSRPAMDRFAAQVAAAGPAAPIPARQRVGIFTAVWIQPIPGGGVRFLVEGAGFFRSAGGFAYSPNGPPPSEDPYDLYTPIGGGWYVRAWNKP